MSTRGFTTVRFLMIFCVAAALSAASCRNNETTEPAAAGSGRVPTGTVAGQPADLTRANIHEVINTRGIEAATQSRIGNSRGPDGNVANEVTTFKPSDPVFFTMWLPDAPTGLQISAMWLNENGKVIREDRLPASGAKVVTFERTGKPLKPGKYHVTGYWGGNVAADKDFTVEAATKVPPKKSK